jgi:hypothetical protein
VFVRTAGIYSSIRGGSAEALSVGTTADALDIDMAFALGTGALAKLLEAALAEPAAASAAEAVFGRGRGSGGGPAGTSGDSAAGLGATRAGVGPRSPRETSSPPSGRLAMREPKFGPLPSGNMRSPGMEAGGEG